MRLAVVAAAALLTCFACQGQAKEHAQRVEKSAKDAAKQAQTVARQAETATSKSIGLGQPVEFTVAMKGFCDAVPDNGKTFTKQQQQQLIKDALYKHPNGDLLALWTSIETADHDTRFQKILEEVDRAGLRSCHLLDLMYAK